MKYYVIYLAAGNSRRFGSENKLLHEFQGKSLYLYGLDLLQSICEKRSDCVLIVVTQYEEIRKEVSGRGISVAFCRECRKGISYSIRAGLSKITAASEEDYLVFVVADQPFLTEKTVLSLLACAEEGCETASVCCQGKPGNPTLFSMKLKDELSALEGDQGGRKIIKKHSCQYIEIQTPEELWDLDYHRDSNDQLRKN